MLSTSEAAKLLHVSQETLRRLARQDKIPMIRTEGGHRRFRKSAVIDYVCREQPPSDTITITKTYQVVWEGRLIVSFDGKNITDEVTYHQEPLSEGASKIREAIFQGTTWCFEPGLQVYFDPDKEGCVAQHWFVSHGGNQEIVEEDIRRALPRLIADLKSLTAVQGVTSFRGADGQLFEPGHNQ